MQQLLNFPKIYKTSERRRLQSRSYRLKKRELRNQQSREWRRSNPLKVKAYKLRWNLLNKEKNALYAKRKREKYKDKIKLQKHNEYIKNKDHYKKIYKLNYEKNKDYYLKTTKEWAKTHPEERLRIMHRHLLKYGKFFNLLEYPYKYALSDWSNSIMNRDHCQCQICYKPAKHSHHILYKSNYPKLALNTNNGIALCVEHHKEIHRVVY